MAAAYPLADPERERAAYPHKLKNLAEAAVWALVAEAELTPKPGLVDQRGSGAHCDMNLALLRHSATVLYPTFFELARAGDYAEPSEELRQVLGALGRRGEAVMLRATQGSNTHRGAIWTLGLLCAAASGLAQSEWTPGSISLRAAAIARFPDKYSPPTVSHGAIARECYGVGGARDEAERGFPHLTNCALPALKASRMHGVNENAARLNALISIMATLDDTCLLHRGGAEALQRAQHGARRVLEAGGASTSTGICALLHLDRELIALNSSPGGCADLLAAALFLDRLTGDIRYGRDAEV